jgi:DNA-binding beta-propeller fold protein YncE
VATYDYDDFHVTLTPRSGETYDLRAVGVDGVEHLGTFTVPLSKADLEHTVLGLARSVRDIGGGGPPRLDGQQLGAALADALLGGEMGQRYDDAVRRASDAGRGLRLSLSLADAPELLNLPWEFLYRRPRFLASQRHSPLVRHLDTGSLAPPPSIETTVRMLGVIASPTDLTPLDVASERQRVEQAVAKVAGLGRVQLDWLEPATPRTLRQKLRDDSYHILHYVGHSDFTAKGEGLLFLEGPDGRAVAVDSTAMANLLSDQTRLRLVVLNSCDGARTSLVDPYAGVATTLIQLGVPAVVAMQFEITDAAAIVFADELYTNLIGRQDPIDAAVAEARKAIYIEVDKVEWATPVLFVRDPDVELFRFEVEAAPLPPPPPPVDDEDVEEEAQPPPRPWWKRRWVALVAAALVVIPVAAALLVTSRGDCGGGATGSGGGTRADPTVAEIYCVPDGPYRIAAVDSSLWITNHDSTTVTRLDASTGDEIGDPVEVGDEPAGVDADEHGVWVAASGANRVLHIDPSTSQIVGRVDVLSRPRNVLVTEHGVWVAAWGSDSVFLIDPSANEIVGDPIPVSGGPRGVAEGDGYIWVSNSRGIVVRIDPLSREVDQQCMVDVGGFASGITATEGSVWVTNSDDDIVVRIDSSACQPMGHPIQVPEHPRVLATDGTDVWVSSDEADTVSRIDADSGEVTWLRVGGGPTGLEVTPDGVWVAQTEGDRVSRIDPG